MTEVILRQWKDTDFEPFASMNSDPEVMRYLVPQTVQESRDLFDYLQEEMMERDWGVWAVEVDSIFAGMVGLHVPKWQMPFSPCTEVLWRFRQEFWGRGIAYQAAKQAINYGLHQANLENIVTFTTPLNHRSIRLMERLGFERDKKNDFDHPEVPEGDLHKHHIFFRLKGQSKILGNSANRP